MSVPGEHATSLPQDCQGVVDATYTGLYILCWVSWYLLPSLLVRVKHFVLRLANCQSSVERYASQRLTFRHDREAARQHELHYDLNGEATTAFHHRARDSAGNFLPHS